MLNGKRKYLRFAFLVFSMMIFTSFQSHASVVDLNLNLKRSLLYPLIIILLTNSVDISQLEELMQQFVATGPRVTDSMALRTVAVVMAKLSQDDTYMRSLEKLELMFPLIQLLLDFMGVRDVTPGE